MISEKELDGILNSMITLPAETEILEFKEAKEGYI
jgi:hypothetical protein